MHEPHGSGPAGRTNRILIAGMGNILRGDDGFGVEVARSLAERVLPAAVRVVEVGIGGIHLVQELMDGYDALVVVDAVERGVAPGTVQLLEAEIPDLIAWPEDSRRDFLADMHYTTPSKALILAKALDVLPPQVFILGCQPADTEGLDIGLNVSVAGAIPTAVDELQRLIAQLQSRAPSREESKAQ